MREKLFTTEARRHRENQHNFFRKSWHLDGAFFAPTIERRGGIFCS
jgi:hypothetical protein